MNDGKVRVLFVCLGNICRSPLAEGVFRDMVAREGLADRIEIDSAGLGSWHVGDPPDARSTAVAERRGIRLTGAARQVAREDLDRFDLVLAMDAQNMRGLEELGAAGGRAKLHMLREFDPEAGHDRDVPDPYYGGADGFDRVHDMVERACEGLLDHLRRTHL